MVRKLESAGSVDLLNDTYAALERKLVALYQEEGLKEGVVVERTADFRYYGQEHTISVPVLTGTLTERDVQELSTTFHQFHEREYGFCLDSPVELVNLRVSGTVRVPKPTPQYLAATQRDLAAARPSERMVYWSKEGRVATVVLRRDQLPPQARLTGPAIIEEPTTTVLIPGAFAAGVDDLGNLILERT
jgi:N-methylhydantoinase A